MLSVLVYRMNFRKVDSTDYESANVFVSIHVILIKERYRGWNFGNVAFVNAKLHRIERRVKDDEWTCCMVVSCICIRRACVYCNLSRQHIERERNEYYRILERTYDTAVRPRNVRNCGIARPKRSQRRSRYKINKWLKEDIKRACYNIN